ncbi:MAG: hypothetical protein ACR2HS_02830, partial [Gammaproteobacteria bacterium]
LSNSYNVNMNFFNKFLEFFLIKTDNKINRFNLNLCKTGIKNNVKKQSDLNIYKSEIIVNLYNFIKNNSKIDWKSKKKQIENNEISNFYKNKILKKNLFNIKKRWEKKILNFWNIFLFNLLFNWAKNQHKNNSNFWVFKKYWLFLQPFTYFFLSFKKKINRSNLFCSNAKISFKRSVAFFKEKKNVIKTWYLEKYKKKIIILKLNSNTELKFLNSYFIARLKLKNIYYKKKIFYLIYNNFLLKEKSKNSINLLKQNCIINHFLDNI